MQKSREDRRSGGEPRTERSSLTGQGRGDSTGSSTQAGNPSALAHFGISAFRQPCTCWDLLPGMDSVQSPGVPSTGHPEAFFLLSQMPEGVASFSYRGKNKSHLPCQALQASQTAGTLRREARCISSGPTLLGLPF